MSWVEVERGGVVESRHEVHAVVCGPDGRVWAATGEQELLTYYRSAAKPMQALPLVEEGVALELELEAADLALCSASHEGEPVHVEGVRRILARAGLDEGALRCGPHLPYSSTASAELLRQGAAPSPVHNNCSGKHAGMLALAVSQGWPVEGYHRPEHPVQRRMLAEISRWSHVAAADIACGVDGCGVVCFAVPLRAMAYSFARFTADAGSGGSAATIVAAMTAHPHMVGGTGRLCTELMARAGDRVFAKVGAEGVYAGGLPEAGLGFALKVRDGARRAADAALVALLEALGVLDEQDVDALARHARPIVRNTRGEEVGTLRAHLDVPAGIAQ